MLPNPSDPFGPASAPDPFEEYGGERPVSPAVEDCLTCAESDVHAALDEERALWEALFASAESELSIAQTGVTLAVSALIGQIDTELRDVSAPQFKAIDRIGDAAMRELIAAEETLRAEGVDVPATPEARSALLDDPTGEHVLGILMGSGLSAVGSGFTPTREPEPDPVAPPVPPSPPLAPPPPPAEHCECEDKPPEPACPAPVINVLPAPVTVVPPGSGLGGVGGELAPPRVGGEGPSPSAVPKPPGPAPEPMPTPAPKKLEFYDVGAALGPAAPIGAPEPGPPAPDPHGADPSLISFEAPQWWTPNVCGAAERVLGEIRKRPENRTGKKLGDRDLDTFSTLWRKGTAALKGLPDYVLSGFDGKVLKDQYDQSLKRTSDILGGTSQLRAAIDVLPLEVVPDPNVAWHLGMTVATFHHAAQELGFPGDQMVLPYTYLFNYAHPWAIPSQGELDTLFVSGKYQQARWECLTRAHGNDPTMRLDLVELQYARPSPSEIAVLKSRGYFDVAPDEYMQLMRLAGVAPTNERWFEVLTTAVPGPSDLVRFMTRDAADEAVAARYALDKDFELKLYGPGGKAAPGPMAAWMRANGVTEDHMRYDWRSHWVIPSNTALYEQFHRLREDRDEVQKWDDRATGMDADKAVKVLGPRPPVVTINDVRRALETNDMAPAWVDPMLAISFHPINRTDVIDGYHAGSIDEAQFISYMRDNGYSPENAKRLLDIQRAKKGARLATQSGVLSVRKVMRYYKDGAISSMRADELLTPVIIDPAQRLRLIQGADAEVDAEIKLAFLRRARRAYLTGAWSDDALANEMFVRGIEPGRAEQLRRTWFQEREGRFKEPAATMVVKWCQNGIVTPDEAYDRLRRIGYDDVDSRRIVSVGIVARNKAVETELGKQERALTAVVTSMNKARKTEEAALKKRETEIRAAIDRMNKEGERIRKELASRLPG